MFGEVLVFAAFLFLFVVLIAAQPTDVSSSSVVSSAASDGLAPVAADASGGAVEEVQASRL